MEDLDLFRANELLADGFRTLLAIGVSRDEALEIAQEQLEEVFAGHVFVNEHYYDGTDIPIRVGDRVYHRSEDEALGTLVKFEPEQDIFVIDWDDIGPVEYTMECIAAIGLEESRDT
ncbi:MULTISPECIES: hypothetical protein [Alicyclobacillus]|uniref:Uncharacterized protein n=1 Tax=Alicyclobacillus acidocaldarius (strain Tc-4-1) TaxID=1048834 RepID=F8IDC2_ALIAT|nr:MULTISPECIES: hypothetical protein [Alicyclobacillus]AEJ43775.1 hypothetical protein TC41_1858 [Alicyclobacillus acidocaldarius subsp. acidocaldarius Tc-4-1]